MAKKKNQNPEAQAAAQENQPQPEDAEQTVQQQEEADDQQQTRQPEEKTADDSALKRIAELEKMCGDYLGAAQRALADFENYKRRNEAVRSAAFCDGAADMATALLPVIDNFERAVSAAAADEKTKPILDGVCMIHKQLLDVLAKKGVVAIECEKGQPFDPSVHHAIMTAQKAEGDTSGSIAALLQKGYKMNEKVIRYAMVSVFE